MSAKCMQSETAMCLNGARALPRVRVRALFDSLVQGAFHLSFTVLVRYRVRTDT